MGSINTYISDSLSILQAQEEEYQMENSTQLKDHIQSIKFGLQFLQRIYIISNQIMNSNRSLTNTCLVRRIAPVVKELNHDLLSLLNRPSDKSLIWSLDRTYSILRETMKNVILNGETREYDFINSKYNVRIFMVVNKFLVESLQNLLRRKADIISPLLKEKLVLLEALLTYMIKAWNHSDAPEEIYATLKPLIDKSAYFIYSCLVIEMDEEMGIAMDHNISYLLEKNKVKEIYITIWRASTYLSVDIFDCLVKILESNTSFVMYLSDSSLKLCENLKFINNFLLELPEEVELEKFNYLGQSIEDIISGVIPILYSCYGEDMKEEVSSEVNGSVSEILNKIQRMNVEVREMNFYSYPKTDELGFVDQFLEHLEELLNCSLGSVEILTNEIETLHKQFDSLRDFLRKYEKMRYENKRVEDLWTRIIGLAYQAEYIIDFFLVKKESDSRIMFSITKVIEKTKIITSEIQGIDFVEEYHTQTTHSVANSSDALPSQDIKSTSEKVVVGIDDEFEKVVGLLSGGSKKREVVSIVGMPGLGKTTLAKKIFDSPLTGKFDVRAWCTISQTYKKKKLLKSILGSAIGDPKGIYNLAGGDLDDKLYKYLKGRRYLIVLDDIWDIEAWKNLVRSFPEDMIHSRILITSRLHKVASQINDGSQIHYLRHLSNDESLELFQKQLFEKVTFSQEFFNVGKQIAESCKGLPIAIVVAAVFL